MADYDWPTWEDWNQMGMAQRDRRCLELLTQAVEQEAPRTREKSPALKQALDMAHGLGVPQYGGDD